MQEDKVDGIRILDIDGKLYRVTGYRSGPGTGNLWRFDHYTWGPVLVILEPLIPDKIPDKPRYCVNCGKELPEEVNDDAK